MLEVENLFLIEPLIKLAAKQIGDNENEAFQKVSDFLFEQMEQGKYDIVNSICIKEIRHKLNCFSSKYLISFFTIFVIIIFLKLM